MPEVLVVYLVGNDKLTIILERSPCLAAFLRAERVELRSELWNGRLRDFPGDRHRLVYCSDNINGSLKELKKRCQGGGHVLFYNDQLIDSAGRHDFEALIQAINLLRKTRRDLYPG